MATICGKVAFIRYELAMATPAKVLDFIRCSRTTVCMQYTHVHVAAFSLDWWFQGGGGIAVLFEQYGVLLMKGLLQMSDNPGYCHKALCTSKMCNAGDAM